MIAPGVMELEVLLHTLKFTVSEVGNAMIDNIPVVRGMYPVTAVGSPLNDAMIASVARVPVAEAVWAEVQVSEEMALVERAFAPLAMVVVLLPAVAATQLATSGPLAYNALTSVWVRTLL